MPEHSLEEVIQEEDFLSVLQSHVDSYFRLTATLLELPPEDWKKKHLYQLTSDSDDLESFLDDYGARYNRTYSLMRELVASLRWFGMTGFSMLHLQGRLDSYEVRPALQNKDLTAAVADIDQARSFIHQRTIDLMNALRAEASRVGVTTSGEALTDDGFEESFARTRLPRNVGQQDPADEEAKIAEVASRFVEACGMLDELAIHHESDPKRRAAFLARVCTEEKARVYEATVHNLQSAYDTHIKNTVLEGKDDRLPRLRGHSSAALHLLEAVTFLTHFVERHESGLRTLAAEERITQIIDRHDVQDVILNVLLHWAHRFMQEGRVLAEDLLPAYTNVQELTVELPEDVQLHARPAALIVGIVSHFGTPVELEVQSQRCNAASILDLLVTVGSHPDARCFVFRGDEKPLHDIALLFQHGLGEAGVKSLPSALQYLKSA